MSFFAVGRNAQHHWFNINETILFRGVTPVIKYILLAFHCVQIANEHIEYFLHEVIASVYYWETLKSFITV